MSQVKIVEKAILSVDKKYLQERYKGDVYVPYGLMYGEKITDRCKKRVRQVCGHGYPGGDIAVVIDQSLFHNFGDGYLFTDKGFYATKGNLTAVNSLKKQGIPPLEYVDIVSAEVVKIHGKYEHIRICTSDDEYTGFASIYAPFICEALKKIIHDLWDTPISPTAQQEARQTKKEAAAKKPAEKPDKAAPAPKSPEVPERSAPAEVTIDTLWEEAMAQTAPEVSPKKESPSTEQTPEKETPPAQKPRPIKPLSPVLMYKNQIRMISDGSADDKAAALCERLQKAATGPFTITTFTSTDDVCKMMMDAPAPDHLLIYIYITQFEYRKLKEQLSRISLAKAAKIIVYLDGSFDDDEVMELIECEITELCELTELLENKLFFVRSCAANGEYSIKNLVHTLQMECSEHYRHTLPFRMPVEQVFHVSKDGQSVQIIHGQVLQGSVQPEEKVCLVDADGAPCGTVIQILDASKTAVDIALPGMRVDLLLKDIPREAVTTGRLAAVKADGIELEDRFSGAVYVNRKAEGGGLTSLYEGLRCTVAVGAAERDAVISKIYTKDRMLSPGCFGYIEVQTILPLPLEKGMTFRMQDGEKRIAVGLVKNSL